MVLLLVGGALGTLARYGVAQFFAGRPWAAGFPWATLTVNVVGSFVLAVAAVLILERLPPNDHVWFLLVGTGFCGGFTTFSTFEWETFKLLREGRPLTALGYVGGSCTAGFVGILLGVLLAQRISPPRL